MQARYLALGVVLLISCAKVPYTKRAQYNLVPDAIMEQLGKMSYTQALGAEKKIRKGDDAETLKKVGNKIAKSAKEPDYEWEETLIESDEINAWCMPGGKIGFYTGILPVLKNEAGMAFVMGHEVAHATAKHGAERLTQQLTLVGGLAGLAVVLDTQTDLDRNTLAIVMAAVGAGAEVGILLPFSRMHESEADIIGTMYMASAGYPPEEGIKVWDRMSKETGGSGVPTFLSTHPSDDKRQDTIREWLPQAKKRYERNKLPGDTQAAKW